METEPPSLESVALEQALVATQKLDDSGRDAESGESEKTAKRGEASLVLIHPAMLETGLRRPLCKDVVVVGRDESADLTVPRGSISRRHAELRRDADGGWLVADMGSTNGTFLNDEQVDDAELQDGDHVQFGDAIFKFVRADSADYHDRVYAATILDGITSIYNQRYFFSRLDIVVTRAQRSQSDMALLVIDIDWLAALNEERGRLCGDFVLRNLAARITQKADSEYLCARIGGEGFGVLLPHGELDDALELAQAIRESAASKPMSFEGQEFDVTVSIGAAASSRGVLCAKALVDQARSHLASAKENGRNCVSC